MNGTLRAACRGAALLISIFSLPACVGDDVEPAGAEAASAAPESSLPISSEASVDSVAGETSARPDTATSVLDPGPVSAGRVPNAESVCPTIRDTLALAADAGWGPGAGVEDPNTKAAITAQLVIGVATDDAESMRSIWDGIDVVAANDCPDEARQLLEIYGAATLRDVLDAV